MFKYRVFDCEISNTEEGIYRLDTFGDTISELIDNTVVVMVDKDGEILNTSRLDDPFYEKAIKIITEGVVGVDSERLRNLENVAYVAEMYVNFLEKDAGDLRDAIKKLKRIK